MTDHYSRRGFLRGAAGTLAAGALAPYASAQSPGTSHPNVVLIRFGGGVRRQEVLNPDETHAPFFLKQLAPQGTLYTNMVLDQIEDVETSHGQGTLYLLTGKYAKYEDVGGRFLGQRFEAQVPTLFEYLRKQRGIPAHQALLINGEDRTNEEFYNFSNHHLFGVRHKSTTISLYRFKRHLLARQLAEGGLSEEVRQQKAKELAELNKVDYRLSAVQQEDPPEIEAFYDAWRGYYGDSNTIQPRGDALLTEFALWAMRRLQPRLMMINYNDPDYVHWGIPAHYYRGISRIDRGIEQLWLETQRHELYRDNTVFVIVPDCGRDNNPLMQVPFQHHFNSRGAHEIFACAVGPGIARGKVIAEERQQIDIAPTIGALMGVETAYAEGAALEEVFA